MPNPTAIQWRTRATINTFQLNTNSAPMAPACNSKRVTLVGQFSLRSGVSWIVCLLTWGSQTSVTRESRRDCKSCVISVVYGVFRGGLRMFSAHFAPCYTEVSALPRLNQAIFPGGVASGGKNAAYFHV